MDFWSAPGMAVALAEGDIATILMEAPEPACVPDAVRAAERAALNVIEGKSGPAVFNDGTDPLWERGHSFPGQASQPRSFTGVIKSFWDRVDHG